MLLGSEPVLLPTAELARCVDLAGDTLLPRYFASRDALWLGALLEEYAAWEGKPRVELRQRLGELELGAAPKVKRRIACRVLDRFSRATPELTPSPRDVRAAVFSARSEVDARDAALCRAAEELAVDAARLEPLLFADLPHEARVAPLPAELGPLALSLEANLALVASLLARATVVRVNAFESTRALLRRARLSGLICATERGGRSGEGLELQLSGPFSLFRHTALYGRRLASLVPWLARCQRFELEAECALSRKGGRYVLRCRSGDPLPAGPEPGLRESRVEERFVRDFRRLGSDWELVRDPEPAAIGEGELLLPDIALELRGAPARRFWLEIVGFWTRHSLEQKLARLARAGVDRVLLCVDAERGCRDEELPEGALVVPYRRKIDAAEVLRRLEAAPSAARG